MGIKQKNRAMRHIRTGLYGLAAVVVCCVLTKAEAGVHVTGAGAGGGPAWAEQFLFDTGADRSFISRACATKMGLMKDVAPADGVPDASTGSLSFNGGAIQTWCFAGVAVAAVDSAGKVCSNIENVYVSKTPGDAADDSILGEPWQGHVDACYRAKGKQATWPWNVPPVVPKKPLVPKVDTKSAKTKKLVADVNVAGTSGATLEDFRILPGSNFSIIPASTAALIGTPAGSVDLSVVDPELLGRLGTADMNPTGQTVFPMVTVDIEIVELSLVSAAPINVLVSDDLNSDFGIMGDDMLMALNPPGTGQPELIFAPGQGTDGQLILMPVDCDGNGLPDDQEIAGNPLLDQNGNGILDVCELPTGAGCIVADGTCVEGVTAAFATLISGLQYQGDGTVCASVTCPSLTKAPAVSAWGRIVLAGLVLAAGMILILRRRQELETG